MHKNMLRFLLASILFIPFSSFATLTSAFVLTNLSDINIIAHKINTSLYDLKNTTAIPQHVMTLPLNNLRVIHSNCKNVLPAFGSCQLLISFNPGDQTGLLKTHLTITDSKQIKYDLPMQFNVKNQIKKSQSTSDLYWQSTHGPGGAVFKSIAISSTDSNTVYVATAGAGVYKSTDAGQHWQSITGDLPDLYVSKIVLNKNKIYVITDQGLFKSIDQGLHWQCINNGLPPQYIGDFVTSNDILYAGTTWNNIGLYKSLDDGQTWTITSPGYYWKAGIESILVKDDTIYVGVAGASLNKSTDGGKTWVELLQQDGSISDIRSILEVNGVLYAGGLSWANKSILKSTDSGVTWSSIFTVPDVYALASQGNTLFAATDNNVYKTSDSGMTWNKIGSSFHGHFSLALTANDTDLYVGNEGSLYKSQDAGAHWTPISEGINGQWIKSILALANGEIFAGTAYGMIFHSLDNGLTWNTNNPSEFGSDSNITSIAQVSTGELIALASGKTLYRSSDNGASWVTLSLPPYYSPSSMFVDGSTIYINSWLSNTIYRSSDAGNTWWIFSMPITTAAGGMTIANNTFFTPCQSNWWVVKTNVNGTEGWSNNLSLPESTKPGLYSYQQDQKDFVFAATSIGLYLSKDNGETWSLSSSGMYPDENVVALSMHANQFFAQTEHGVYISNNAGNSWNLANDGLNPIVGVNTIANSDHFVYLGTQSGLYQAQFP